VPGAINLHSPPTSDLDRSQLREVLGDGEVQATFHADGVSRFSETGIPGVWWVEHRDRDGDLIAELLEVAPVPEILCSAPDETAVAVDVLQARMLAMADLLPARIAGERNR
jgi:hydrogenase-1 operon protein HyaF